MAPEQYATFEAQATAYQQALAAAQLTDEGVANRHLPLLTLPTLAGLPVWAYGWFNHLIAYQLPRWLERRLQLYCGYEATVKIIGGLLTFPLGYGLQFATVYALAPAPWPWLYLISLPLSGWLAWQYTRYARPRWQAWRYRRWAKTAPAAANHLANQRADLLMDIMQP